MKTFDKIKIHQKIKTAKVIIKKWCNNFRKVFKEFIPTNDENKTLRLTSR